MRRFASVFARHKDKEASKPDLRRSNTPLPTTPALSSGSEPASSASSNGSASLQTPEPEEDVHEPLSRTPTKKAWTTWLGKKTTIKRARPSVPAAEDWVQPVPQWRPQQTAPILQAPPPAKSHPHPPRLVIDSDEDASESESDDDEPAAPTLAPPLSPTSLARSRKNLEILIQNSLIPSWASSPFACPTGEPMYPRSSNSPRSLPVRNTMRAVMHKTLMLRRLHDTDQSTRPAQDSLLPFASRPSPTLRDPPPPLPWYHVRSPPATMNITLTSPGLRRWMSRPCFEERFAVWAPVDGLEFSASLEAMIGFDPSPTPEESPVVAPGVAKNMQPTVAPSPLRNSALKASMPPVSRVDANAPPTTSRVRFAEDDKDDVIPLGYALRLKKRREDKAKFLREEQERRAFELEKARQEEERMRRELERKQWEEEKRAWEREKKAMEEERKQRIYAEEVAAARARREHQRAGGSYGVNNSMLASSSTASLRDERNRSDSGKYSRPLHDQRRQASEPAVVQQGSTPSSSPHTSSPASSRPPSIHQTGRNSSRPPSVHSEDSRQPTGANAAKRSSMASLSGKNPVSDRSSMYSLWSASNPVLMPPVPPMPMYTLDMPLLPPTPPFMLHQYPRPRSQESRDSSPGRSSPSGSPSRQRLPSNSSSDRVNLRPPRQSSSSSRRGSNSSTHRPEMTHQRRSSDDSRHASLPAPKEAYGSLRSPSSSSLARGRAAQPPSSFLPPAAAPWTAPPLMTSYSQQQLIPAAGAQWTMPPSKRRQTTIS
ncbi:hypothetical protein C8F01DRAFT_1117877 [Mycena amicta]|nr:hypothetical protein C8F01DRAFT_1117877 [Mycena amicta]